MATQQRELREAEAARQAVCTENTDVTEELEHCAAEVNKMQRVVREKEEELG